MRYPSSMRISSAKNRYNSFDLSRDQITTCNFSVPFVSYIKEIVPGDHFSASMESLVRLTPLANPTFGRITLTHRFFFVPFRSIFRDWLSFINQTPVSRNGSTFQVDSVPYAPMYQFAQAFWNTGGSDPLSTKTAVASGDDPDPHADFVVLSGTGTTAYNHYLTRTGRCVYNLLLNLGYNIDFTAKQPDSTQKVSLMPILAYIKVFLNYYYPPQYNVNQYDWIFEDFQSLTVIDLLDLLKFSSFCVSYDPDYFVSAWDHPSSPSGTNTLSPAIIDDPNAKPSQYHSRIHLNADNVSDSPTLRGVNTSGTQQAQPNYPTAYILNMLDKVQDYVTRNRIAGYRPVDRFLARFGIHLDYKETNRALYLGSSRIPIKIEAVTSSSDTFNSTSADGAPLGYQAGQGKGYQLSDKFEYKSSEFGYLICVSSVTPHVGYYMGTQKENQHISPLDFYTPEFDGAGVQAISFSELFNAVRSSQQAADLESDNLSHDSIFGYVPRFAEYKVGNDVVSGDFRSARNYLSFQGFHLMRQPTDEFRYNVHGDFVEDSNFYHGLDFVMQTDSSDYLRIFTNKLDTSDHFVIINHAEVHATRPMLSIVDGVEFYDKNHNQNKDIEVTNNGATFN